MQKWSIEHHLYVGICKAKELLGTVMEVSLMTSSERKVVIKLTEQFLRWRLLQVAEP